MAKTERMLIIRRCISRCYHPSEQSQNELPNCIKITPSLNPMQFSRHCPIKVQSKQNEAVSNNQMSGLFPADR
jgi:hypothetical protein